MKKFTSEQYEAIILYLQEFDWKFKGGNTTLPPALVEELSNTKLVFQYIDSWGDRRTFESAANRLPDVLYKLYGVDVVVMKDNFPYITIFVDEARIPAASKGKRLLYAIDKGDSVYIAKEFAAKFKDKAVCRNDNK